MFYLGSKCSFKAWMLLPACLLFMHSASVAQVNTKEGQREINKNDNPAFMQNTSDVIPETRPERPWRPNMAEAILHPDSIPAILIELASVTEQLNNNGMTAMAIYTPYLVLCERRQPSECSQMLQEQSEAFYNAPDAPKGGFRSELSKLLTPYDLDHLQAFVAYHGVSITDAVLYNLYLKSRATEIDFIRSLKLSPSTTTWLLASDLILTLCNPDLPQ